MWPLPATEDFSTPTKEAHMSFRNPAGSALMAALLGAVMAGCATQPPAPAKTEPAKPAAAAPAQPAPPPGPPAAPAKKLTPADAAMIASNCFTCHGPDGHSPGTIPSLDKLTKKRVLADMKDFRTGEAPSTVMGRHAKGYSDAEIEAIADYLESLKKK
jgi:sulfide dehydrogenase cytochrome subunit